MLQCSFYYEYKVFEYNEQTGVPFTNPMEEASDWLLTPFPCRGDCSLTLAQSGPRNQPQFLVLTFNYCISQVRNCKHLCRICVRLFDCVFTNFESKTHKLIWVAFDIGYLQNRVLGKGHVYSLSRHVFFLSFST